MGRVKKDNIERVLISTRIDRSLVKPLKQIALDGDRDLYMVIEEAIKDYIQKKQRGKK